MSTAYRNRHHPAHLSRRADEGFTEARRCVAHARRWKIAGRDPRSIADMVRHAFRVHRDAMALFRKADARRLPELPSRAEIEGAGYNVYIGQRFALTQAGREALAVAEGGHLCHFCDLTIRPDQACIEVDGKYLHATNDMPCATEMAELHRMPGEGVDDAFAAMPGGLD